MMDNKMLLTIPYQTLEVGRIHMSGFVPDMKGRLIAPLSYCDTSLDIEDFILLSPPLTVLDYDMTTGRLRLDVKDQKQFATKVHTMQQYIISTIHLHSLSFLQGDYTSAEVQSMFQVLLDGEVFSIFVYPTTVVRQSDGTVSHIQRLKAGDRIRFPLYVHGIMIVNPPSGKGMRLRIQHNVPYVWKVID
jgi:hypothetical protein